MANPNPRSVPAAKIAEATPVLAPLLVMALVYLVYAWDRVVVPVALVEVRAAYGLSLSSSSVIASVFTFGLALTAFAVLALLPWPRRAR